MPFHSLSAAQTPPPPPSSRPHASPRYHQYISRPRPCPLVESRRIRVSHGSLFPPSSLPPGPSLARSLVCVSQLESALRLRRRRCSSSNRSRSSIWRFLCSCVATCWFTFPCAARAPRTCERYSLALARPVAVATRRWKGVSERWHHGQGQTREGSDYTSTLRDSQ